MKLYKYNTNSLTYECITYKQYLYTICIILFIGSGVGFTSSVKFNNAIEKIPIIVKIWQDEEKEFSFEKLKGYIREMNFEHQDVVIAQCILESGTFQSPVFKHNNNLTGMKISTSRVTTHQGSQLNHAMYKDWQSSLIDYGIWQSTYARNLTKEQYLMLLDNIYAEDKLYSQKLLKIIKDYNL